MATAYTRRYEWLAWTGTTADIGAIAAAAERFILESKPNERRTSVTIDSHGGVEYDFDDVQSFVDHLEASGAGFGEIDLLTMGRDIPAESGLSIHLSFNTSNFLDAVTLQVRGSDADRVAYVATALHDRIDKGKRFAPGFGLGLALVAGLGLSLIGAAVVFGTAASSADRLSLWRTALAVGLVVIGGLLVLLPAVWRYLVPNLEITDRPGSARASRAKLSAWRLARWLAAIIVAAVVGALVERYL